MTYATTSQRQALISGLRGLADFLEENPEVPAPASTYVLVFPPCVTNAEKRREIVTSRAFGAVEYRAVAIPSAETMEL